jgi:Integrase zinc binding domain
LATLAPKVFFDKNKLAWIDLDKYNYPMTALWLPEQYRKEALCETHDSIFAGHNAAQKSYLKLTMFYFWLNVYSDAFTAHTDMSMLSTTQDRM